VNKTHRLFATAGIAALTSLLNGCASAEQSTPKPRLAVALPQPADTPQMGVESPQKAIQTGSTTSPAPIQLPGTCEDPGAPVCVPPRAFVNHLCAKQNQDLAIALFAKSSPFARMYLRGKFDELAFDEEVLALRSDDSHGVVTTKTYDVLRWNGLCSRGVHADILTDKRPPKPRAARISWSRLSDHLQTALIVANGSIKKAHVAYGHECMLSSGDDMQCDRADVALSDAIVSYLRSGGRVPQRQNDVAE
jgi:hypothetical protein